ncbi:hypothetical protein ACFUJ0_13720 [Streptomyces sp. NPDC057242]|uniref:hypothetical protein n=1 Tax=unclassified Streptomyces TaxID=2593676 RepID=UPI0036283B84
MTTALLCAVTGAALAGCSDGAAPPEPSAAELLDRANDTMKALTSVTVDWTYTGTATGAGGDQSGHMTTDLKDTCAIRLTRSGTGTYEQIRLGDTAYARSKGTSPKGAAAKAAGAGAGKHWTTFPVDKETAEPGPTSCTQEFASFGTATKGEPTEVGGTPAIRLVVTDKADKGGTYTFHVATEGRPYILKVDYKGPEHRTTTTYSAFDRPLDVRPPAAAGG